MRERSLRPKSLPHSVKEAFGSTLRFSQAPDPFCRAKLAEKTQDDRLRAVLADRLEYAHELFDLDSARFREAIPISHVM